MTDIVERLRAHSGAVSGGWIMKDAAAEIERLINAIRRIDGINDNPADYNPAINAICDAILRSHLEPPFWCDRCEGRGYLVTDAEWEPYAVQCPDCHERSAALEPKP